MLTAHFILILLAFICAVIAAIEVATPRINLIALALSLFFLSFLVSGCAQGPVHTDSPAAHVASDVQASALAAIAAYADAKAGNANMAWSLSKGLNAYRDIVTTSADVKALVAAWTGNTGDSQKLADRLARIFAASPATPEQKTAALAVATQTAAARF